MTLGADKFTKLEKIYSETRDFFETHANHHLARPAAMGGNVGFCILYTPPKYNADIAVVGQNPSTFDGRDGLSAEDKLMMSGNIPEVNSYMEHDHPFAEKLKRIFSDENGIPNVLENCIGMNIWFFQGTDVSKEDGVQLKKIKDFCQRQTLKVLALLRPRVIFTPSFKAFDICDNMNIANSKTDSKGRRYFAEGSFGGEIPVFGCAHITGKAILDAGKKQEGTNSCVKGILTSLS